MIARGARVFVVCLATALAVPAAAAAQAPPPCQPDPEAVPPSIEFRGDYDLAEPGGPVYATHPLQITLSFGTGEASDVKVTVPAGVRLRTLSGGGSLQVLALPDRPGPLPISATWTEARSSGTCTASIATTAQILPARSAALYLLPDPVRGLPGVGQYQFDVRTPRFGPRIGHLQSSMARDADLSPLTLEARVISRARFPRPGVRASRLVVPLREDDVDLTDRKLRIPGVGSFHPKRPVLCKLYHLACSAAADVEVFQLRFEANDALIIPRASPRSTLTEGGVMVEVTPGDARGAGPGRRFRFARAYGLEIRAFQGGKVVARFRAAGRCARKRSRVGFVFTMCRTVRQSVKLS